MVLLTTSVVLLGLAVVCVIANIILRRSPQPSIIYAKKSYIIKKKIILETPAFDATFIANNLEKGFDKESFNILAPLVKIDSVKTVQVDLDPDELSKCGGTQYELPLDSIWEMDRAKLVNCYFKIDRISRLI